MPSQELIQTLFHGKKNKLRSILDWVVDNCDNKQLNELTELLGEYHFTVTYANTSMMRTTHEFAGRQDSIIHHVPDDREQARKKPDYNIEEEIHRRKQIVNGFQTEIAELEELK